MPWSQVQQVERDDRYRRRRPIVAAGAERRSPPPGPGRAARLALAALALLPWLLYFALVFCAWWLVMFDGDAGTDPLGWGLLALALPCLFVAGRVSRWERRWIRARFEVELWGRRPSGGGGLLDWLGGP